MIPTSAQIEGLARLLLGLLTGYVLSIGIDEATWLIIVSGIVAAIGVAWTLFVNSRRQLINEVAKNPEVTAIIVDSAPLADSFPSIKVTSQ